MLEFICLFFPSLLGVALIEHLLKRDLTKKQYLTLYVWVCLLSNVIVFFMKWLCFQTSSSPFAGITVDTALRFIPMALISTALVSLFTTLLLKRTELQLEPNETEKTEAPEDETEHKEP